jgi:hypothetical protein
MKYCIACGMPLNEREDFSLRDENSEFCHFCTDNKGQPKPCSEIFEGGVRFFIERCGATREFAEKVVRKNMRGLPYWKDKNEVLLVGEVVSDEEFEMLLKKL